MTNTIVAYEGKRYRLLKDAYLNNFEFEANAICLTDKPNEDGWQTCYQIYWYVLGEFIGYKDNGYPYLIPVRYEDKSLMADWDSPDGVIEDGEYNAKYNCIW